MKIRGIMKNMLPKWFCRTYFGVPLVAWLALVVVYYWWLIVKIIEAHNRMKHLNFSKMYYDDVNDTAIFQQDPSSRLCETVHIAIICSSMRKITPMLKSLLYHRQNPLHLHLIVDAGSERKVHVFFTTWDLPDVKYSYYNIKKALRLANKAKRRDAGDNLVALMLLPDILPVREVLVLNADLTILCDVFELWEMFGRMSRTQFIGLVEDHRSWNKNEITRWPPMAHYNTGVMLLDLRKLQKKEWRSLWQDTFNEFKNNRRSPVDKCVVNGVISRDVVFDISCRYNVQMAVILKAKSCYGYDARNVKIIHWNAKVKDGVGYQSLLRRLRRSRLSPDVDYFMGVRSLYAGIQGDKLRHKFHRCSAVDDIIEIDESDNCTIFHAMKKVKLLTHIYYMDYKYHAKDNDVTLIVQLSMNRILFLERLAEQWEGPISTAIYVASYEVQKLEQFIEDSEALRGRNNISYHIVFKSELVNYPINYLRNVALENVNTPYVFLIDVDFVLITGLYELLRTAVEDLMQPAKKCLVVPAFETRSWDTPPPRTKADLLLELSKTITPFKSRTLRGSCHKATNYSLWVNATQPYEVKWQHHYEPYLVMHRSAPKFDTRFSGYGWNKISHSVALRVLKYSLVVLPDAFVVHTPHAESLERRKYDRNNRRCINRLKKEFIAHLVRKYKVTHKELQFLTNKYQI